MDRQQGIGFLFLFALIMAWFYFTKPSAEEIERAQFVQDSIQQAETAPVELEEETKQEIATSLTVPDEVTLSSEPSAVEDSMEQVKPVAIERQFPVLENEKLKITFDSKGGRIKEAILKDYDKLITDKEKVETRSPLKLMEDEKDRFEFLLPIRSKGNISTQDIVFDVKQSGNEITFTTAAGSQGSLSQTYTLGEDYMLDFKVNMQNMSQTFEPGTEHIDFRWHQYLDKIEQNTNFEKFYSTVYFKTKDDDSDYCSCRSDDDEDVEEENIHWISHVNQFFNASIVSKDASLRNGVFKTIMLEDSEDLKLVKSEVEMPIDNANNELLSFNMYIGPNEFNKLQSYELGLEEIIPFGRSIFGSINRWVIRPAFNWLSQYIGSKGVVIIVLIFILKMILYPLMYKMLKSQAKMSALKPEIAAIKEKFKDDQQKLQMETMKLYREYGASPLGGCMPMLLQMPIWYALFRFFPASIRFRQEPFLWANDLSSYDVFTYLPMEIPGFGSHLSLFTILWAISTVAYTYYNTKHVDMSANPAMKYVQYAMPLMFLVFFNNYASGLTCYMFFSNIFNILQTVVTKRFVFDNEKIRTQLMAEKDKPKKAKSGFQSRLEEAMKQQQEVQKRRNQQASNQRKKKKR